MGDIIPYLERYVLRSGVDSNASRVQVKGFAQFSQELALVAVNLLDQDDVFCATRHGLLVYRQFD